MDGSSLLNIFLIIVLVALSAFFSASETSFSSLSKARLKNHLALGNKKAKKALDVYDKFDTALSAILIGNNIVNIAAASVGTVFFTGIFKSSGAWISTIVMTITVLIFGEVVPKSLAKNNPEKVAINVAHILSVLMIVFKPLIWVLRKIINMFAKKIGDSNEPTVTEEELKFIIDEIEDEGVIDEEKSDLVRSAIEFDDITVDEILTPRVDVTAVDVRENPDVVKDIIISTGYSRLPVYEDTIDNIIGVINQKDFFKAYLKNKKVDLNKIKQDVIYIPPKKCISELMKELQKARIHIAVVTDPYGGTIGIITLEDIIEELVGEIWDESDKIKSEFIKLDDNTYRVSGDMNIYDLFEKLDINSNYDGQSQSVNGWALEYFERIPDENESFEADGLKVTVEKVDEQRIISFIIKVLNNQED